MLREEYFNKEKMDADIKNWIFNRVGLIEENLPELFQKSLKEIKNQSAELRARFRTGDRLTLTYSFWRNFYQKIDDFFKEFDDDINPICEPGCYGCCRSQIMAFSGEAVTTAVWLKTHLKRKEFRKIYHRLRKFRSLCRKKFGQEYIPSEEGAEEYFDASIFCPFLDKTEGLCQIYEVRPYACRYLVTTDCDMKINEPSFFFRSIEMPPIIGLLCSSVWVWHQITGQLTKGLYQNMVFTTIENLTIPNEINWNKSFTISRPNFVRESEDKVAELFNEIIS